MACFIFVSFYLMAKSKGWNFRQGQLYKFCLFVILPICLVLYIGFSRAFDHRHSEFQILAGWLIGGFVAPWVYKYHYGEIFGFNAHIPNRLMWSRPSFFRDIRRKIGKRKSSKVQPATADMNKSNSLEESPNLTQTMVMPDSITNINPGTYEVTPPQTVAINMPTDS